MDALAENINNIADPVVKERCTALREANIRKQGLIEEKLRLAIEIKMLEDAAGRLEEVDRELRSWTAKSFEEDSSLAPGGAETWVSKLLEMFNDDLVQ